MSGRIFEKKSPLSVVFLNWKTTGGVTFYYAPI